MNEFQLFIEEAVVGTDLLDLDLAVRYTWEEGDASTNAPIDITIEAALNQEGVDMYFQVSQPDRDYILSEATKDLDNDID